METKAQRIRRLKAEIRAANSDAPSIAEMLEFRRNQYGLTKYEFAEVLGMQPSHYSEVISGKRQLSFSATKRAYRIGVPADVLLSAKAVRRKNVNP